MPPPVLQQQQDQHDDDDDEDDAARGDAHEYGHLRADGVGLPVLRRAWLASRGGVCWKRGRGQFRGGVSQGRGRFVFKGP